MPYWFLRVLDLFFVIFHTAFTLFVAFGWLRKRWRGLHAIATVATAVSWFGIGLFTTIGYCFLTDWHWQVLYALGERSLPRSYVQYLIMRLLSIELSAAAVDAGVAVMFAVAAVAAGRTAVVWWRGRAR